MVVAKLTALCKDSGMIDKRFPVQRAEISFARLKPKVSKARSHSAQSCRYASYEKFVSNDAMPR